MDSSGDYTLGSGSDFLKDSPDAVAQAVMTRLKLWKSEWFVDTSDGTPYMQDVLGKRFQRSNPDSAIKSRILGTPGVTEITSYDSTFDGNTRAFSVTATINTFYGAATISETL
jgi:hypothetical protein